MEKLYKDSETGCCPRFDPKPWDKKTVRWKGKLFIKDHVRTIFRIPMGFGKVMVRNVEKIEKAGALPPKPIMLYDCKSLFGADLYIHVSKPVPGADMAKVSGTFLSKVFEGHYKDSGKWVKEMLAYVKSKGKDVKKIYFYYTTCPSCAKHYGENYTVLLAKV